MNAVIGAYVMAERLNLHVDTTRVMGQATLQLVAPVKLGLNFGSQTCG